MLDTTMPKLTSNLKEPLARKVKSLLQEFFNEISVIRIDKDLTGEAQDRKSRAARFAAQDKMKRKLGDIISNTIADIAVIRKMILQKMYPSQFSPLSDKKVEGFHQQATVIQLLSSQRTRDQLNYYFDFFVETGQLDAAFHMYELLQKSYQPQNEKYPHSIIEEIRGKVENLKSKLGINDAHKELKEAEAYLRIVEGLYNHLSNQVDLVINGFGGQVNSDVLQMINENTPDLYNTILKNKYPMSAN